MNRYLVAFVLLGLATPSLAISTGVMPRNATGAAATRVPIKQEATQAMADDSSGLRKGTLDAVDVARSSFHVFGEPHTFDAAKLRIFGRDGKLTSVHALRRGAAIRFTLDPDDVTNRRVAVVYLD